MVFKHFLFFSLLFFIGEIQAATVVTGVRIWSAPDRTRLVFDISKPLKYHIFTIKQPNRVVIDLENTKFKGTFSELRLKDHFIRLLRHASRKKINYRIVLDLKRVTQAKHFLLKPYGKYGHRLVIDLTIPKVQKKISRIKHAAPVLPKPQPVILPQPRPRQLQQPKPLPKIAVKKPKEDIIIAIDAGHGGDDSGAKGPTGALEKRVVLQIAKKLKKKINQQKGMRAFLTRKGDYFIELRKRMTLARTGQADLFISIHADAFKKKSANGSSVYVVSNRGASSEAARWLAKSENLSNFLGGVQDEDKKMVGKILLDISKGTTKPDSLKVAKKIYQAMAKINRMHAKDVQKAGFVVLKSPDIPSVLVETAFISNPKEEKNLRSRRHQQKIANAIFNGIKSHFKEQLARNKSRKTVVKYGDTLSGIAMRYQVKQRDIKRLNKLRSSRIFIGQQLLIPDY